MKSKSSNEMSMVPIDDLKGADYNPRQITPKALAKLKTSLREFGMPQPVIVNSNTGLIVGGHQRWKAAKELGWTEVPVTYMDLTDDEERVMNIALNNGELTGDWDMEQLAKVLQEVDDKALLEATGFDAQHIDKLIEEMTAEDEEEIDPVYPLAPKFLESYDYVVIFTTHQTDWANLQTLLDLEQEDSYKNSKVGLGRVLTFDRFRQTFEKLAGTRPVTEKDEGSSVPHDYQAACKVCRLPQKHPLHG